MMAVAIRPPFGHGGEVQRGRLQVHVERLMKRRNSNTFCPVPFLKGLMSLAAAWASSLQGGDRLVTLGWCGDNGDGCCLFYFRYGNPGKSLRVSVRYSNPVERPKAQQNKTKQLK